MKVFIASLFFGAIFSSMLLTVTSEPTPYILQYDSAALGEPFIPKDNPLTEEGVRLGRLLFYDPLLSSNNEMSCGTCHIQSMAFTDGKDLAIGTYGDTLDKNTMSLVNLAWGNRFFWDGRAHSLEELVRDPIINQKEMAQDTIELVQELESHEYYPSLFKLAFPNEELSMNLVSKSIAQFLRTIVSNGVNVDFDALIMGKYYRDEMTTGKPMRDTTQLGTFFRTASICGTCHGGASYGGNQLANNGLTENGVFMKAPSLVNITKTAPYMHDGRFKTLGEVLKHYRQHIGGFSELNPELPMNSISTIMDYDIANADNYFLLFDDEKLQTDSLLSDPFRDDFDWNNYLDQKR